ncbi:hypothetical protein AVEN_220970-1 [Araneus ventricosus]|uniref:Uncharacterized protein n=1 Tax=Araneus ventricosus TaxID=182803 RepID=A0A4Y2WMW1_ARAVE|nr:hypothetical protein AVEN_220970-1 [Araneus ventricosus]
MSPGVNKENVVNDTAAVPAGQGVTTRRSCPPIGIKIKEENEIWQQQQDIKNLEEIGISFNFDYATEVSPWKITSILWRTFNETNYVGLNVFTDGSKINNRVGCAMVVLEDKNEKEHEIWRLNNETTVFIAEMVAIREAVNYCKRRQIAKANIISNSRSVLVPIESLEENRKFILDIKKSLDGCWGLLAQEPYLTKLHQTHGG